MLLSVTGICKIWEWYLENCGQTANKQTEKQMETMTDSLRLGENDSLRIKFSKSLWHMSIIFETLHGKVEKTWVNVLNSFDRCKTFANIRNLHEATENHMCPFTLTILPLKHFNSHHFKLIWTNEQRQDGNTGSAKCQSSYLFRVGTEMIHHNVAILYQYRDTKY